MSLVLLRSLRLRIFRIEAVSSLGLLLSNISIFSCSHSCNTLIKGLLLLMIIPTTTLISLNNNKLNRRIRLRIEWVYLAQLGVSSSLSSTYIDLLDLNNRDRPLNSNPFIICLPIPWIINHMISNNIRCDILSSNHICSITLSQGAQCKYLIIQPLLTSLMIKYRSIVFSVGRPFRVYIYTLFI